MSFGKKIRLPIIWDGVTVAKVEVTTLENMGAQLCREVASKTNDVMVTYHHSLSLPMPW